MSIGQFIIEIDTKASQLSFAGASGEMEKNAVYLFGFVHYLRTSWSKVVNSFKIRMILKQLQASNTIMQIPSSKLTNQIVTFPK